MVRIEKRDDLEVSFGISPVLPRIEIKREGAFFLRIYQDYSLRMRDDGSDIIDLPNDNLLCENPYLIQKEGRDVLLCQVVTAIIDKSPQYTTTRACYFIKQRYNE